MGPPICRATVARMTAAHVRCGGTTASQRRDERAGALLSCIAYRGGGQGIKGNGYDTGTGSMRFGNGIVRVRQCRRAAVLSRHDHEQHRRWPEHLRTARQPFPRKPSVTSHPTECSGPSPSRKLLAPMSIRARWLVHASLERPVRLQATLTRLAGSWPKLMPRTTSGRSPMRFTHAEMLGKRARSCPTSGALKIHG